MDRDSAPSWQQLIDWLEGRLTPTDAEEMRQLVARSDAATMADVAWIRAFLRVGDEIVLEEPPAELRKELRVQFAKYAGAQSAGGENEANLFQRLVAMLSFDSSLQPGLAPARAGEMHGVRQLIYACDALDISLAVRHVEEGFSVDGQILPNHAMALGAFHVRLEQTTRVIDSIAVDEAGLFSFVALSPGVYQLHLSSAELDISTESLDLNE